MATSSDFHAEISKSLECGVCMSILDQPKVLKCHHWFCKTCIDELLEFNTDGSAVITCPMKCKCLTFIESNQTTNELPIPYQLTGLLDVFLSQNKKLIEDKQDTVCCDGIKDCEDHVSLYCNTCNIILCNQCGQSHNENVHHNIKVFLPIQLEMKSEKIMVMCKEHSTFAKYVCCKSKFICVYCKHRRHRVHQNNSIQFEADQVREFVGSHEVKFDELESVMQKTVKRLESTNASIKQSRLALELSLKNRKVKRMSDFLALLDDEEADILAKYDDMVQEHINQYPEIITKDYFTNTTKKHDIQIIIEKERIMKNIFSFTSDDFTILPIHIELMDSQSLHKNPLGKLKMGGVAPHIFHHDNSSSSVHTNCSLFDNSEYGQNILANLKKSVDELLASNAMYAMAHPNSFIVESPDVEQTFPESEDLPGGSQESCSGSARRKIKRSKEKQADTSEELELEETFDYLKEQLCESVDHQFDTLLKAIQDQFILSEGLNLNEDEDGVDSDEVAEEVEETEDFAGAGEQEGTEESTEDIEQICNQS